MIVSSPTLFHNEWIVQVRWIGSSWTDAWVLCKGCAEVCGEGDKKPQRPSAEKIDRFAPEEGPSHMVNGTGSCKSQEGSFM